MADSSRAQLYYAAETSWGEAPAGEYAGVRTTGFSPRQATETTVSEELRSDRQVPNIFRTGVMVEGDFGFELSYGSFDDFLAAALAGDWQLDTPALGSDRLENGVAEKSFTLEHHQADEGAFLHYRGCRVGSLALEIAADQIITGTVSVMGSQAQAGRASDTHAAPGTTEAMNATSNITLVEEGGAALAHLRSVRLTIENGLRAQSVIGQLGPRDVRYGRFNVNGSMQAYFTSTALLEKYLDFVSSALKLQATDTAGNVLEFNIPRLRYTGGEPPVTGNDEDVMAQLDFQGFLDPTTDKTAQITRTPAA